MKWVLLTGLALLVTSLPVSAGDPGTAGAVFLKLGVDGRAIAMGEAQTGFADNANALYWNPAGLSRIKGLELAFMHNFYFQGMHHDYLGLAVPLGNRGSVGLAAYYWTSGTIMGMDQNGLPTSEFSAWDLALGLYYANRFNRLLSAGCGIKTIIEKNEQEGGSAYAVDAGLLFRPPLTGLGFGVSIQNVGTRMKLVEESYPLPLTLRLGAAWEIPGTGAALAADIGLPQDDTAVVSIGGEYWIAGLFALRTGYKSGSDLGAIAGLRAGCGFNLPKIGIDYAFAPYGELGNSHTVSLLVKM